MAKERVAVVGVGQTKHQATRGDVSMAGLVREAARREVRRLAASETPIPLSVHQALNDINEPNTKGSAITELLTWLGSQSEEAVR
jgi:hypothetical protein